MTIKVTINDENTYTADHLEPGTWNGFVRPAFTPAQALAVARGINATAGQDWHLESNDDGYVEVTDDGTIQATYRLTNGYYLIGADAWTWETVNDRTHAPA